MPRLLIGESFVTLWASARDTEEWATRPGARWPCSTLSGHRFAASFDGNGLFDLTINGKYPSGEDIDGHEFSAMVSDLLRDRLPKEHPAYHVTVGQFLAETDEESRGGA